MKFIPSFARCVRSSASSSTPCLTSFGYVVRICRQIPYRPQPWGQSSMSREKVSPILCPICLSREPVKEHWILFRFLYNFCLEAQYLYAGSSIVVFFDGRNVFGWIGRNVTTIHQMLVRVFQFTEIECMVVAFDVWMAFFRGLKVRRPQFDHRGGAIKLKTQHLFRLARRYFWPPLLTIQRGTKERRGRFPPIYRSLQKAPLHNENRSITALKGTLMRNFPVCNEIFDGRIWSDAPMFRISFTAGRYDEGEEPILLGYTFRETKASFSLRWMNHWKIASRNFCLEICEMTFSSVSWSEKD